MLGLCTQLDVERSFIGDHVLHLINMGENHILLFMAPIFERAVIYDGDAIVENHNITAGYC